MEMRARAAAEFIAAAPPANPKALYYEGFCRAFAEIRRASGQRDIPGYDVGVFGE